MVDVPSDENQELRISELVRSVSFCFYYFFSSRLCRR